ncbi:uncharacterized protein LTR77_003287 [Saxophila tyrrhenica]|uniref:Uncharacterized protein n=1 Tax=Saxophila tyrrhenica TaxID=1690608 RepID=A0AAV9PKJ5_9PEZI|nr:hypothetical protein LTR77_003287 [Saxophila tyrrhenica]
MLEHRCSHQGPGRPLARADIDVTATTMADDLELAEQQRLFREEHNATKCPLLTLPAELRLAIYEDLIDTKSTNLPGVPDSEILHRRTSLPPDHECMTQGWTGLLRTCRTLRKETLPFYMRTPILSITAPRGYIDQALLGQHTVAIQNCIATLLSLRDISKDTLVLWSNYPTDEGAPYTTRVVFQPTTVSNAHAVHDRFVKHPSGVERRTHPRVRALFAELNEGRKEGRRLEKDDVWALFALLASETWPVVFQG